MTFKVNTLLNYFSHSKPHLKTSVKNTTNAQVRLKKLEKLNSEKGSIIITALGTGLIAPIMIAFNPFTNEEKATKQYSALRQPFSAVLSLFAQLGINKQAINVINTQSKKGNLGHYYDTGLYMTKDEAVKSIKKDFIQKLQRKGHSLESALKKTEESIDHIITNEKIKKRISKSFTPREEKLKRIVRQEQSSDYKKFVEEFLQNPKARFEEYAKRSGSTQSFEAFVDDFFKTPITRFKERIIKDIPNISPEDLQVKARQKALDHVEKIKKEANNFTKNAKRWKIKHKGQVINDSRSLRKTLEMVPKYTNEFKNRAGFVLAVLTIPITCSTLNWVYPKVVNFAFPKIAQSKKGCHDE